MAISFDGSSRIITIGVADTYVTAQDLYSRWKDWALLNPQYLEAFRPLGGDPLGNGLYAPTFYFLRTDFGWKIRLPEASVEITIDGNLVAEVPGDPLFIPPVGAFSPTLTVNRTQSPTVVSGSGGSSLTASQVWSHILSNHPRNLSAAELVSRVLQLSEADEVYNANGSIQKIDKDNANTLLVKELSGMTLSNNNLTISG